MECICTTCQSYVCSPDLHTYCWEPSLVFLPNLTNRLFGKAAGKVGGLGGRELNSSDECFAWFIPVDSSRVFLIDFKCSRQFNTEASYCTPVPVMRHCFASFLGRFHPGQAVQSNAAAAAASVYALRIRRRRCFQPSSSCWSWRERAAQSGEDGSSFNFISHRWIKCDWLITGQKMDRSEHSLYLWRAQPDGADCFKLRTNPLSRCASSDSANSWRRQVHTPAHKCRNFQNKTSLFSPHILFISTPTD